MIENTQDLHKIQNIVDVCPKKYIIEVLQPIMNFRRYKAFDNTAIREFSSILRATTIGLRLSACSRCLSMCSPLPPSWGRCWPWTQSSGPYRLNCIPDTVEAAFKKFVE